jgi:RNA polymerase sigma-70 factor (ECF subfamily)
METDAALVENAKAGDPDAFRELYERHRATILKRCQQILKDSGAAEDATQETFLRAFRRIGSFRGASQFGTWIGKIALHASIDHLGKHYHHCEIPFEAIDLAMQFGKPNNNLVLSSERRELDEAIGKIPPKHRQMLYLRAVMGYSYADIAIMLDCDIPRCKSRYRMATINVRRILARPIAFRA